MGKSTAAEMLRSRGLPVADSDVIARQVVEPGEPALREIVSQFGPEMVDAGGRLRRDRLAARVFHDETERKKLEAITHPRIRQRWQEEVARWRSEKRMHGVAVVPLIFEVNLAEEFDCIICIACSAASQRQRLQDRGWSEEQLRQRLAAQWPIDKKMALSDFVVWSEGTLDVLAAQLDRLLASGPS